MDYTTLGRTGLNVSVMGLGAGGHSRLGQSSGKSQADSVKIVRKALDLGVNFFDTAEAYGTEAIVGEGLQGVARDQVVISTKKTMWDPAGDTSVASLRTSLEGSLKRLRTDYIDIYNLHGLQLRQYDYAVSDLVPELEKLRDEGKIRFLGVTEAFGGDNRHDMLVRALEDDCWDVMMVGFNLLNHTARRVVFPKTIEKNIGVQIMFAVRTALSNPQRLSEVLEYLAQRGEVDASQFDMQDPLGFLVHEGGAESVPDAAYRFCRHEPGTHVILSGTGNPDHLAANAASINRGPLPKADLQRIDELLGRVQNASGE